MVATVLLEHNLTIPAGIRGLDDFRRWTRSQSFPERGRIDFIHGRIEIDLAPRGLFTHSAPKTEIGCMLANRVKKLGSGHVFIDGARFSSPAAGVSAEPDVMFVSHESIGTSRVRLVPDGSDRPRQYSELEGAPDLIAEVVSSTSVIKDTKRLFQAYYDAGVTEYWIADARGDELSFTIYRRGRSGFVKTPTDRDGFRRSRVMGCRFRFDRERGPNGVWIYDLIEAE
jgi:Uma2 family endonuclease